MPLCAIYMAGSSSFNVVTLSFSRMKFLPSSRENTMKTSKFGRTSTENNKTNSLITVSFSLYTRNTFKTLYKNRRFKLHLHFPPAMSKYKHELQTQHSGNFSLFVTYALIHICLCAPKPVTLCTSTLFQQKLVMIHVFVVGQCLCCGVEWSAKCVRKERVET